MSKKKNSVTFGIMPGPIVPWPQFVEWAKLIEELGFDKIWVPDHFINPEDISSDWFECWTALAGLVALTKTITLGSLVASMTLRHPVVLERVALEAIPKLRAG